LTKFDEIGELQDLPQNFWTKFALFEERKMAFFAAKSLEPTHDLLIANPIT